MARSKPPRTARPIQGTTPAPDASTEATASVESKRRLGLFFGDGALLLALFLAPVLGGVPTGAQYAEFGGDVYLNLLRMLVCIGGIASFALRPLPPRSLLLIGMWGVFGVDASIASGS